MFVLKQKNHQARDCPIKASTSKLYKVMNVLISIELKVEDGESKNKDDHSK